MLASLLCDTLTISVPADIPDGQGGVTRGLKPTQTVPGRIEAKKQPGHRVLAAAGDVPTDTHIGYVAAATYNADGTVAATTAIPPDAHISKGDGNDYLVIGTPKPARLHAGQVDHLEVDLRLIGGAI